MLMCVIGQAQQWDKYIPEKQRKGAMRRAIKFPGVGASLGSGTISYTIWITEEVARSVVSRMIDRERITPEEAEERYKAMRLEGMHVFGIATKSVGSPSPIGSRRASKIVDPLTASELFIQCNDDRKVFSKGTIADLGFDIELGMGSVENVYVVSFPRMTREGHLVVKDLSDKIEIQYSLGTKKVILDYKIKDIVTRLEDL
jgi:hypothetical protein